MVKQARSPNKISPPLNCGMLLVVRTVALSKGCSWGKYSVFWKQWAGELTHCLHVSFTLFLFINSYYRSLNIEAYHLSYVKFIPLCWRYMKSLGFVRWEAWAVNCWRLGGYSRKVLASACHIPVLFPRHLLLTIMRKEYQARWTFKLTRSGHFYNMVWLLFCCCFLLFWT